MPSCAGGELEGRRTCCKDERFTKLKKKEEQQGGGNAKIDYVGKGKERGDKGGKRGREWS